MSDRTDAELREQAARGEIDIVGVAGNGEITAWREGVGRPCKVCAAFGRFTWLGEDGTCRRDAAHEVQA